MTCAIKCFIIKKKPKPRIITDLIDQRPIPILPYNYYFPVTTHLLLLFFLKLFSDSNLVATTFGHVFELLDIF